MRQEYSIRWVAPSDWWVRSSSGGHFVSFRVPGQSKPGAQHVFPHRGENGKYFSPWWKGQIYRIFGFGKWAEGEIRPSIREITALQDEVPIVQMPQVIGEAAK